MSHNEKLSKTPEQSSDLSEIEAAGAEHHERLRRNLEEAEAQHKEKQTEQHETLEQAQREATERASSLEEIAKTEKSPAQKRTLLSRQQREASFKRQMNSIQAEMTPGERRFSKIIHNKTIEAASETVGSTLARPNALLSGSIFAFLLVTIIYLLAKHYGYQLSGFETIGAFIVGWILGFIYDYVKLLISGKKQ